MLNNETVTFDATGGIGLNHAIALLELANTEWQLDEVDDARGLREVPSTDDDWRIVEPDGTRTITLRFSKRDEERTSP